MKNEIILKTRYKVRNYLKLIKKVDNSESNTYLVKTEFPNIRVGYTSNNKMFIDLDGGPMLIVGDTIEGTNRIIKDIIITNLGYAVILSKDDIPSN